MRCVDLLKDITRTDEEDGGKDTHLSQRKKELTNSTLLQGKFQRQMIFEVNFVKN